MLVRNLLAVFAAMVSPLPSIQREYSTRGEQTVLSLERERNFKYEIRLSDEDTVSTFCVEFTFKQMLIWDDMNGASGFHVSCKKGRRNNRKLVIWIHGGPWTYASKDMVLEQMAFLEGGYDLFIPLYPGSADRPIRFEGSQMIPDVVDALTEIKAAFGWAEKRYKTVDVVGESFGAFLATSLVPNLGSKNSLYLHNPSLGGPGRLAEYYASQGEDLKIEGVPKEASQAEAKRITNAYFARLENYHPRRLLESTKGLKLKLVYGGRDRLMVPDEIKSLERLAVPVCGVDYRPDNGHEFARTRQQFETFRAMIRCGAPSPSPSSASLARP
jgi:pimeloyl-ACP methyl ester carboxylesterase